MKAFIDGILDHHDLNDTLDQPSAENLARFLYERFKSQFPYLHAVEVSETPKTWAAYSR
jgi:6-pyruvoyltetrahydropterin/6-carboxytetrahydropterin synthase